MVQQKYSITSFHSIQLLPRVIRAKDAPGYLGMSRDVFNASVRPFVPSFRIGKQGVGFDRLDLDEWLVQYKASNERSAKSFLGDTLWVKENHYPDLDSDMESGTLTNDTGSSQAGDFNKALALVRKNSTRRKRT